MFRLKVDSIVESGSEAKGLGGLPSLVLRSVDTDLPGARVVGGFSIRVFTFGRKLPSWTCLLRFSGNIAITDGSIDERASRTSRSTDRLPTVLGHGSVTGVVSGDDAATWGGGEGTIGLEY